MKFKVQSSKFKVLLLVTNYLLLVTILGCDAFVRKFTRKPKRETPKEELVLAPEEYKAQKLSREDLYRQYWLFWKSWHNELIDSLSTEASHKKQVYCINEAIKNLEDMKALLKEENQNKLGVYISQLKELRGEIEEDLYGNNISRNRLSAEHIKRGILRDFSYNKIREDISYGARY